MKVTYLLNLDFNIKAGLFNCIHNRMKIQKEQFDAEFYNVVVFDSKLMQIMRRLLKKNVSVKYTDKEFIEIDGVKYKTVYFKNSFMNKFLQTIGLESLIYKKLIKNISKDIKETDLIIAHWGYPHGRIAYYINKIFKKDYIVYYHGSDINSFAYSNDNNKKIILEIMENAKQNIFVSNGLKNQAIKLGYKYDNVEVTNNGIDINYFKPKDVNLKNQLNILDKKVVGFVGNLEKVKRADFLPEIFEKISETNSDVHFIVIGDGQLRKTVQDRCKSKKLPVSFTGRLSAEDVSSYMNIMDVIVLPSRNEAWGCVLLEANACGVYAVGSNVGGIPEVIGSYGALVANDDDTIINEINETISKILDGNFSKNVLVERAKDYSWEKICEKEYDMIINAVKDNS